MIRREGPIDQVLAELLETGLAAGERIELHDSECPVSVVDEVGFEVGVGCTCEPIVLNGPLGAA